MTYVWLFRRWRWRRILKRYDVNEVQWRDTLARLPILHRLSEEELSGLRDLSVLFLHEKSIETTADLTLTEDMRWTIALQACLPILNLGLEWYDGWHSVIVYPGGFVTNREYTDEAGVVHRDRSGLSGESWLRGPLVLDWESVAEGGIVDGHNLVIHEFAHKLDMLNGAPNGMPPLHKDMEIAAWTEALSNAYDDLNARLDRGYPTVIDPYGSYSPAEFFAVASETFFETGSALHEIYPKLYRQLALFYRQDPAKKLTARIRV